MVTDLEITTGLKDLLALYNLYGKELRTLRISLESDGYTGTNRTFAFDRLLETNDNDVQLLKSLLDGPRNNLPRFLAILQGHFYHKDHPIDFIPRTPSVTAVRTNLFSTIHALVGVAEESQISSAKEEEPKVESGVSVANEIAEEVYIFFTPYRPEILIKTNQRYLIAARVIDFNFREIPSSGQKKFTFSELHGNKWRDHLLTQRQKLRALDIANGGYYQSEEDMLHHFEGIGEEEKFYQVTIPGIGIFDVLTEKIIEHALDSLHIKLENDSWQGFEEVLLSTGKNVKYLYECSEESRLHWRLRKNEAVLGYSFRYSDVNDKQQVEEGIIRCKGVSALSIQSLIPELYDSQNKRGPVFMLTEAKKKVPVTENTEQGDYTIVVPGFWNLVVSCSELSRRVRPQNNLV